MRLPPPRKRDGVRVVVAGGGFAGLYATLYLTRSELPEGSEIVLTDPRSFFTFTPMLAEVAAGTLGREHVTYPYRVLEHRHGFRFLKARVAGLDREAHVLLTDQGRLDFDYLILAMGAAPRYLGVQGARGRSLPLTSVDDAVAVRERVIASMESALTMGDGVARSRRLTFIVAGAGPAGVEMSSELLHLANEVLRPYYRGLPPARVHLVHSGDRILPGWDDDLARAGQAELGRRGVELHLNTVIERVEHDAVIAAGPEGELAWPGGTLIWTAGTAPAPWIEEMGLPTERGAIKVNAFLQAEECPRIFAAGDVAVLTDPRSGRPYPRVAPIAISQGIRAAANIEGLVLGRTPERYQAHHAGKIVSLGNGLALVDILGIRLKGPVAWWIYRTAYLLKLVGFKNKIRVLLTLVLNRLFEPDIGTGSPPSPDLERRESTS